MTRLDDVFPRRRNETALTRGWGVRSRQPATDLARPGGAQPHRGSGRVPRGPASPGACPPAPSLSSPSSDPLEVAHELPVGDRLVEGLLLEPRGVQVVLDDALAEGRARDLRALELGDRLAQRLGHLGERRVLVRVALVELRRLEPAREAVEPRGDRRGEREVGVRVRAGDPILDAEGRAHAAEPEAARAVVPPRDDTRRCEGARLVALVGVHARRVEVRQLARQRELARKPVAEERRAPPWRGAGTGGGEEGPPAGLVPGRRVEMERGARRTHVVLRHEGDRRAHQVRDLLRTVLVESRAVGHLERLRVAEVDLLLAAPPLSLRRLDRNVGAFHPVPDRADQRLLFRRLQDVIVLEVARDGRQVVIALRARALEGLRETVELELGGSLGDGPLRRGALDLALEHPPRRLLDRLALLRVHVAEDEGGLGQPREETERPEVRDHLHVAVATLPGRELEARQGLHLHVDGEKVDAGVRALVGDVVEEVAPDDALAHEAAERVGKDGEDRVDLALPNQLLELLERETARHDADSSARQPPVSSSRRAPHATREQPARADRLVLLRLGELRVPHDGGDGVPRALADDRDQGRRRRGRVRLPAWHTGPPRAG